MLLPISLDTIRMGILKKDLEWFRKDLSWFRTWQNLVGDRTASMAFVVSQHYVDQDTMFQLYSTLR